jgi:hypothetical protein
MSVALLLLFFVLLVTSSILYFTLLYFTLLVTVMWTERRNPAFSTPASYSGGSRFKYRLGDQAALQCFSWLSSVSPGKSQDSTLNYAMTAFFHTFSIYYSLVILSFEAVSLVLGKKGSSQI